jgi:type I restriction-modification system DNA methylase subunit
VWDTDQLSLYLDTYTDVRTAFADLVAPAESRIDSSRRTAESAIALIHHLVGQMGFLWREQQVDAGVDGEIELCNPANDELTNRLILVQSKASDRPFPDEDDRTFQYHCNEADIAYWMSTNVPVILVCSHARKGEAWWVHLQGWFSDPSHRTSRRIDFDKRSQRFDAHTAHSLLSLADASFHVEPGRCHKLTLGQLEKHLWTAADMLRGQMDVPDINQTIVGMMFLKHASDTFDGRREHLIAELTPGHGRQAAELRAEQPELYTGAVFVPARARWQNLRSVAAPHVGDMLNKALAALEEANPGSLEGVLQHIDFARQVGSTQTSDRTLRDLIEHFSRYRLRADDFESLDTLGAASDYLIKRFIGSGGKTGEYYTPRFLADLLVQLIKPTDGMSVYDPCSGPGGLLIAAKEYVEERGGNSHSLALAGQEINARVWSLSKMNLLLHGIPDANLENDDTLTNPRHVESGRLTRFDRVVSNPPFALNHRQREVAFPERFRWGRAPGHGKNADLMFVQHIVSVLQANGVAVTVVPAGVLFRGGSELTTRTNLLNDDIIEAVIGLPPNCSPVPASLQPCSCCAPHTRSRPTRPTRCCSSTPPPSSPLDDKPTNSRPHTSRRSWPPTRRSTTSSALPG